MPIAELPWWPPATYEELTECRVRQLLASLRTVTPAVMAEGERRIRSVVGLDMEIRIYHETVKGLTGKRLGQVSVLQVIGLSAGSPREDHSVRFLLGVHQDGSIMVTPSLNPQHTWSGSVWRAAEPSQQGRA
jgi:hypothetical protein